MESSDQEIISGGRSIARRWPARLWIFAGPSGNLLIMRTGEKGEPVHTKTGGVDGDYVITDVKIPADGGDF